MSSELRNLLALGETTQVEFKEEGFHNDSLAKEMCAFANREGGVILVGIKDDGSVAGVTQEKLEERVAMIGRNNLEPPIIPLIRSEWAEEKRILMVEVPKGHAKPYRVKTTGKTYVRTGTVSAEASLHEMLRLFQEGGQFHFETQPVPGANNQDFDWLRFRQYLHEFRDWPAEDHELESLATNLQMCTQDHTPTVAGILLFGKHPQRWLPQAGLDLCFFAGKDHTCDILDRKTLNGPLPEIIGQGLDFIRFNSAVKAVFNPEGTLRTDKPDYEPFVVRELLVNAFAHRDWSVMGQQVRCYLYEDRLEVFSPGRLPNTLRLENALAGVSYYRNPLIAQVLKDYRLADRLGRGLSRIWAHFRKNSLRLPVFHQDTAHCLVTVWKPL